jgi:hypothetical protein
MSRRAFLRHLPFLPLMSPQLWMAVHHTATSGLHALFPFRVAKFPAPDIQSPQLLLARPDLLERHANFVPVHVEWPRLQPGRGASWLLERKRKARGDYSGHGKRRNSHDLLPVSTPTRLGHRERLTRSVIPGPTGSHHLSVIRNSGTLRGRLPAHIASRLSGVRLGGAENSPPTIASSCIVPVGDDCARLPL